MYGKHVCSLHDLMVWRFTMKFFSAVLVLASVVATEASPVISAGLKYPIFFAGLACIALIALPIFCCCSSCIPGVLLKLFVLVLFAGLVGAWAYVMFGSPFQNLSSRRL